MRVVINVPDEWEACRGYPTLEELAHNLKLNELKKDTMQVLEAYISPNGIGFSEVKDAIKDLLEWSKNEYKRGWCDALSKALKEAHTIHSEEGIFRVIQAETLIGLVYAIEALRGEQE